MSQYDPLRERYVGVAAKLRKNVRDAERELALANNALRSLESPTAQQSRPCYHEWDDVESESDKKSFQLCSICGMARSY